MHALKRNSDQTSGTPPWVGAWRCSALPVPPTAAGGDNRAWSAPHQGGSGTEPRTWRDGDDDR